MGTNGNRWGANGKAMGKWASGTYSHSWLMGVEIPFNRLWHLLAFFAKAFLPWHLLLYTTTFIFSVGNWNEEKFTHSLVCIGYEIRLYVKYYEFEMHEYSNSNHSYL